MRKIVCSLALAGVFVLLTTNAYAGVDVIVHLPREVTGEELVQILQEEAPSAPDLWLTVTELYDSYEPGPEPGSMTKTFSHYEVELRDISRNEYGYMARCVVAYIITRDVKFDDWYLGSLSNVGCIQRKLEPLLARVYKRLEE